MKTLLVFVSCCLFFTPEALAQKAPITVDVCAYGGTSAGVMAAYTAKKLGKSVLLLEPGRHLGSLTTGGLGFTDIGNKYAISELASDYYRQIGQHYGKFEQWIFEPHVAEELFNDYIKRAGVEVLYSYRLVSVSKRRGFIQSITLEPASPGTKETRLIRAKMFRKGVQSSTD